MTTIDPHAGYLAQQLRARVENTYVSSRERSLVLTKLDELELWLTRCEPVYPPDRESRG